MTYNARDSNVHRNYVIFVAETRNTSPVTATSRILAPTELINEPDLPRHIICSLLQLSKRS